MNNFSKAFTDKKALIATVPGGFPELETTEKLILEIDKAGADIILLTIPFSDPIAEDQILQDADELAIKNGCTVEKLFDLVERVVPKIDANIVFMTYMNPVFAYGTAHFMKKSQTSGISGIIILDLPFEEKSEVLKDCQEFDIALISMIASTDNNRANMIVQEADGFLYCLGGEINSTIITSIKTAEDYNNIPCVIEIDNTKSVDKNLLETADGFIIGGTITKLLASGARDFSPIIQLVKQTRCQLNSC